MKHLYLFFFIIVLSVSVSAQQSTIDSLKIKFDNSKIESNKLRLLKEIVIAATKTNIELAKKYNDSLIMFNKGVTNEYLAYGYRLKGAFNLMSGKYIESIKFYQKSLSINRKIGDKINEAKLLNDIATFYARKRNNEEALKYYDKSISLNDSINNQKDNIISLIAYSMIKGGQEYDFQSGIDYLIKALKIVDKYGSNQKGLIHKQIALFYIQLGSYEKCYKHMKEALEYAKKQKDFDLLSRVYSVYGYYYETKDKDFEKALFYYNKALKNAKILGSKIELSNRHYNVGLQYSRLNKPKKAIKNYEIALKISKDINYEQSIVSGYFFLANHYALINDNFKAVNFLKKANKLLKNKSKLYHKEHFYRLGESFNKNGNFKQAYKNIYTYSILADSLYRKNSLKQISNIETKYQTEKKEKENLKLKADKVEQELLTQKANTRNWFLALGLLALSVSAFLIWKRYKSEAKAKKVISKQKDDIETQKNTIENLQKELHHRVKNNLAIIDTFIEVAKEEFEDKKFDTKLTEIQNRISSINEIHSQLYKSKDVTNLNIKNYIEVLAKNVADSFLQKEITIYQNIDDINLNADTSFPIGLIINEFLINSYKYAFDSKGIINIEMKVQEKNYLLALSDNGKGLPSGFDIEQVETFGLRYVKLLAKQLDGVFSLESNNGVQLTIHIPKV